MHSNQSGGDKSITESRQCNCLLGTNSFPNRMSVADSSYNRTILARRSSCRSVTSSRKCRNELWDSGKWIYLALAMLLLLSPTVQGEMRCYCNDANCVTTGYMCKSTLGRCFTISAPEGDLMRVVQGCADALPVRYLSACADGSTDEQHPDWSVIRCCREDMCNSLEISVELETRRSHHNTTDTDDRHPAKKPQNAGASGGVARHRDVAQLPADQYSALQRELWFKAAVIAVPIAGVCVLALLVLLAVRMLTTDVQRHRHVVHVSARGLTGSHAIVSKAPPGDDYDDYYYTQCRCLRGGRDVEVIPVQRWGDAFQPRRKVSLLQYPGVYKNVALLIDNDTSGGCDDGVGNGGDADSASRKSMASNYPRSSDDVPRDLCLTSRESRTDLDGKLNTTADKYGPWTLEHDSGDVTLVRSADSVISFDTRTQILNAQLTVVVDNK